MTCAWQARCGAALGLAPQHTASTLPASTTTGLALTMASGLPLIQKEWVAAGSTRVRWASDPRRHGQGRRSQSASAHRAGRCVLWRVAAAFNSALVQLTLPLVLAATRLTTPLARGVGIGTTAHVGGCARRERLEHAAIEWTVSKGLGCHAGSHHCGARSPCALTSPPHARIPPLCDRMAALINAGEVVAADAAAVSLVVVGVARSVLVQAPPFARLLDAACRGGGADGDGDGST